MPDPAIAAHGLVRHLGPVAALDGIDLAVEAGMAGPRAFSAGSL